MRDLMTLNIAALVIIGAGVFIQPAIGAVIGVITVTLFTILYLTKGDNHEAYSHRNTVLVPISRSQPVCCVSGRGGSTRFQRRANQLAAGK